MEGDVSVSWRPVAVALLVVAISLAAAAMFRLRRRRLAKQRARQHFVRAACLLKEARREAGPDKARAVAERAVAEVDAAIRADEVGDPALHILKSVALEAAGRAGAAIGEMGRALARPGKLTVPERSGALVRRADLEAREGMAHEALEDLERSAALTPDKAGTQERLGLAYEQDGDVDKALGAFERAVQLNPDSPGAVAAIQRLQKERSH